jgi:hypothetical protein
MLIVFLGAAVQGSVGTGFAVVSAPILALLDPDFVPIAPQFLALMIASPRSVRERSRLDMAGVGWVIAGRIPGSLAAAAVLTYRVGRTLDFLIGSIVLMAVLVLASGVHVPLTTGVPASRRSCSRDSQELRRRSADHPSRCSTGTRRVPPFEQRSAHLHDRNRHQPDRSHRHRHPRPQTTSSRRRCSLLPRPSGSRGVRSPQASRGSAFSATGILVVAAMAAVGLLLRALFG